MSGRSDKQAESGARKSHSLMENLMEQLLEGIRLHPYLGLFILVGVVGLILSIGPAMKRKRIGKVACRRCGHVGMLKQTIANKLVCTDCGSGDWSPAPNGEA